MHIFCFGNFLNKFGAASNTLNAFITFGALVKIFARLGQVPCPQLLLFLSLRHFLYCTSGLLQALLPFFRPEELELVTCGLFFAFSVSFSFVKLRIFQMCFFKNLFSIFITETLNTNTGALTHKHTHTHSLTTLLLFHFTVGWFCC